MAGHSKWANIKHKKGAADAKRGKIFTKLIREIQVAAKLSGGDPDSNPRLRDAIVEAKSHNMPKDNIERAIKRGTGDNDGANYEEVVYEGYGPAGVAIMMESLTDNRNRTVSEIRNILGKAGGNLGESGCVAWMFEKKGLIMVAKGDFSEDQIMEWVLDSGGEDLKDAGDAWEVTCDPSSTNELKEALLGKGLKIKSSMLSALPKSSVNVAGDDAEKVLKLMDNLEDHDDLQRVFANFDIDDSELERLSNP